MRLFKFGSFLLLACLSHVAAAQTISHGLRAACAPLPGSPVNGQVWCDSADSNKTKTYSNGAWIILDTTIPRWYKYSVLAIANGTNGCTNANGCWQVNGVLGENKAAATVQSIVLFNLPANGFVSSFRIKGTTACSGVTTANVLQLGTAGDTTFWDLETAYNLLSAVSNTNFSWLDNLDSEMFAGSSTVAATDISARITADTQNIELIATGCAFDVTVLWSVLP